METKLKIACGQFTVSANLTANFRVISKLIHQSVQSDVKVLFLPEASDYLSKNPQHSYKLSCLTKEKIITPICQELNRIYQSIDSSDPNKGLFLSIGVHEPGADNKTINKLLWINNKGEVQHEYEKLHLFDVNIKNGPILKESNSVIKGKKILEPFDIPNTPYKVGSQICYDIRFPELSLKLFKLGANILTFPSAFTVKTGISHWKNLGRTRAIDNQSYVVMAAQCGEHNLVDEEDEGDSVKRISYGNSLIIDPWGDIVAEGKLYNDSLPKDEDGDYTELVVGELDYDKIESIRGNMPLLKHRRDDIFKGP